MALVRIARYHTLSEAEVAASVLRSAGIHAHVSDAHYLGVFWTDTIALGGFRLSVPEEEGPDAVEILRSPPPVEPVDDEPSEPLPVARRIAAGALMLAVTPEAGWLATGRESPGSMVEKSAGALLSMALLFGVGASVLVGLIVLFQLLVNPP